MTATPTTRAPLRRRTPASQEARARRATRPPLGRSSRARPDPDLGLLLGDPGSALPDVHRERLETRVGHDLSQVRVHAGTTAADVCDAVGADAVTIGRHVFFAAGRYDPTTSSGRALLAHEVWHAVHPPSGPAHVETVESAEAGARDHEVTTRLEAADPLAPASPRSGPPAPTTERPAPGLPALHHRSGAPTGSRGTVRVVELLVRMLTATLRADPQDRDGRVRGQLARLDEHTRGEVVRQARAVLSAAQFAPLAAALDDPDPQGAELSTPPVPAGSEEATGGAAPEHADPHEHPHDDRQDHDHPHGDHAHDHDDPSSPGDPTHPAPDLSHAEGPGDAHAERADRPASAAEVTPALDPHADDAPAPPPQADTEHAEPAEPAAAPDPDGPAEPRVDQPQAGVQELAGGGAAPTSRGGDPSRGPGCRPPRARGRLRGHGTRAGGTAGRARRPAPGRGGGRTRRPRRRTGS